MTHRSLGRLVMTYEWTSTSGKSAPSEPGQLHPHPWSQTCRREVRVGAIPLRDECWSSGNAETSSAIVTASSLITGYDGHIASTIRPASAQSSVPFLASMTALRLGVIEGLRIAAACRTTCTSVITTPSGFIADSPSDAAATRAFVAMTLHSSIRGVTAWSLAGDEVGRTRPRSAWLHAHGHGPGAQPGEL